MAKWRNKIEIKHYLSSDDSDATVKNIVDKLIPQLQFVLRSESKALTKLKDGSVFKENMEYYTEQLDELTQEFVWIKESIENNEDPSDYTYSNWCEAFNNYFDQLYDLGDSVVKVETHFNQEKYLWVG